MAPNKDKTSGGYSRLALSLLVIAILPDTNQAAPAARPSSLHTSMSSASSFDHYHYQPASSSSMYRTRSWSYQSRPAGVSYTYLNGPPPSSSVHRHQPMPLAPMHHLAPIGFQNLRFGPFSFGLGGANHPNGLLQPQPLPPLRFGPLQPTFGSNDGLAGPGRSQPPTAPEAPLSLPDSEPANLVESPPSSGSSSSSSSSNRPSGSRPLVGMTTGPINRRFPFASVATNRPRSTPAPPAPAVQPSSTTTTTTSTPPLLSTLSGAVGPAVVNDADLGFDVPVSSNSDSSSLAGPTVSRPVVNSVASERLPATANNNNAPASAESFFDPPMGS